VNGGALASFVLFSPTLVVAQPADEVTKLPRAPWGAPDLHGVLDFRTVTPLERPDALAGQVTLLEEKAAAFEQELARGPPRGRLFFATRRHPGRHRAVERLWHTAHRQAHFVDRGPPDGKIQTRTAAGQERASAPGPASRVANGSKDRTLPEWCITTALVPVDIISGNNYLQLVQGEDCVAILQEAFHEVRIVRLGSRPHLPTDIRLGDSVGRLDADTLVVETTNFTGRTSFHSSGPNMHLVERFTRVDARTLRYGYTVSHPGSFAWSIN